MEMFINIMGAGVALPKTGFGVNLATASYIGITNGYQVTLLGLSNVMSLGEKARTFVFGWIKTDPFFVCPIKHNWATNTIALIGQTAEIELTGTLVIRGSVDLKFTVYDKHGNTNELMSKVNIKAIGGQVSETKVRGVLCRIT